MSACDENNNTYLRRCPSHFAFDASQATALGVVGDTIAQRLERRWNPGQRFELRRTAHAGILNMVIGEYSGNEPGK